MFLMLDTTKINEFALEILPRLRGVFQGKGLSPAEIDDACQDAFIDLVTYILPRYDAERSSVKVETFAITGAVRKWQNRRMRVANLRTESSVTAEGCILDTVEGPEGFAAFERAIEAGHIRHLMASLTEREAALCAAFQACGRWGEAATRIGVSGPTASRMRKEIVAKLAA